jgi:hypothetical protein
MIEDRLRRPNGQVNSEVLSKEEKMKFKPITTLALLLGIIPSTYGQAGYTPCDPTNAIWSLQVEMVVSGFPRPEHFIWHYRPSEPHDDMLLSFGSLIMRGSNSRKKDWRLYLLPKATTSGKSNLVCQATCLITDFDNEHISTNSAMLTMPLGHDFMTNTGDIVVSGKWINARSDSGQHP